MRYLIDAGVQGLAVGGSTGEGQTLTDEESWSLVEIAVQEVAGRVPVIAGIIVDSTRQAVTRGQTLRSMEVTALQVTPVHYLFAPDEQGMYEYYATIASEVGLPILSNQLLNTSMLFFAAVFWSFSSMPNTLRPNWAIFELSFSAFHVSHAGMVMERPAPWAIS